MLFDENIVDQPEPPRGRSVGNRGSNNRDWLEEEVMGMRGEINALYSITKSMQKFMEDNIPRANLGGTSSSETETKGAAIVNENKKVNNNKNKKRKQKKKNQRKRAESNSSAMNWFWLMGGSFAELFMALVSIMLLVTLAFCLDIGEGGMVLQGGIPSLLKMYGRRVSASKKMNLSRRLKNVDSNNNAPEGDVHARIVGEDVGMMNDAHLGLSNNGDSRYIQEGNAQEDPNRAQMLDFRRRVLQESTTPPTVDNTFSNIYSNSEDTSAFSSYLDTMSPTATNLYYPDFENGGICTNDPAARPVSHGKPGSKLFEFENMEGCCEFWWQSDSDECMEKSLQSHSPIGFVVQDDDVTPPSNLDSASPTPYDSNVAKGEGMTLPPTMEPKPTVALVDLQPPTTSSHPTKSSSTTSPNDSHAPTKSLLISPIINFPLEPDCVPDPDNCGCEDLFETDYRGFVNHTEYGEQCINWDTDWVKESIEYYTNEDWEKVYNESGLEGNYCRNPTPLWDVKRAWCYVSGDWGWGFCDIPHCRRPTPSWCTKANNEECGCGIHKQSDYRGKINETSAGDKCLSWPGEFLEAYPNAGIGEKNSTGHMVGNNYCRNPQNDDRGALCLYAENWDSPCTVPTCDFRACMPTCGNPNLSNSSCPSFLQSKECCEEGDTSCKCTLLKEACGKNLNNQSKGFCDDAVVACHGGMYEPNHICSIYEQSCTEFPGEFACDTAADKCCSHGLGVTSCRCDFYTYTSTHLEMRDDLMTKHCNDALVEIHVTTGALEKFYTNTGGQNWRNNSGWLNDTIPYCQWYGVTCNSNEHITEINLRNNNIAGKGVWIWSAFESSQLTKLDLAGNKFSGELKRGLASSFRNLVHIDLSNNDFDGCADMTFSSGTLYANYSNNKFTCASFKRYNPAYEALQVVDLSNNQINQDLSDLFRNIPPSLEHLILSDNRIRGSFPSPFPHLANIQRINVANNNINGTLPDFSRATPRLKELYLSNQRQTENGGLVGTISPDFSNLDNLLVLNAANNNLTSFPSDLGILRKLQVLDLSSNLFSHSIPPELGNLAGALEILNLSNNNLRSSIPESFADFLDTSNASIHLSRNSNLSYPAPLMLCFMPGFDLADDEMNMCPSERNALKLFYDSSKGQEWTNAGSWLDPYKDHCAWHGVRCNKSNTSIIELKLANNGLSGTISKNISGLNSLKFLDLSDNDIKGPIPSELGHLTQLVHLRLSFNELTGEMPSDFFVRLDNLMLIQLHGNRIRGTIPNITWAAEKEWTKNNPSLRTNITYRSSFISDCGNPSDFRKTLICTNCTMCCKDAIPAASHLSCLITHAPPSFNFVLRQCTGGLSSSGEN